MFGLNAQTRNAAILNHGGHILFYILLSNHPYRLFCYVNLKFRIRTLLSIRIIVATFYFMFAYNILWEPTGCTKCEFRCLNSFRFLRLWQIFLILLLFVAFSRWPFRYSGFRLNAKIFMFRFWYSMSSLFWIQIKLFLQ